MGSIRRALAGADDVVMTTRLRPNRPHSSDQAGPPPMTPAASFASLAWGWVVAFALWTAHEVHGPGFGYVTDFTFMLAWPALFVALGWLFVALPVLRNAWIASRLADARTSWIAWPLLALGTYGLLVATWLDGAVALLWFPAVVGFVAGLVFPVLCRAKRPALVATAPLLVTLAFAFVVWPALETVTPYTTYVYGADDARSRSLERILAEVHVGDSFADLAARYPEIFSTPTRGMTGNSTSGELSFTYRVEFDDVGGTVTNVEIERRGSR